MNLKELRAKGAFLSGKPVKVPDLEWEHIGPDGEKIVEKFDVFVLKHSFGSMERVIRVDPDDPERSRNAAMVAESIRFDKDGKDRMSYAEAYALDPSLAMVFIKAINEVNGQAKADPKA